MTDKPVYSLSFGDGLFMPGEMGRLIVRPEYEDPADPRNDGGSEGLPGQYDVHFFLSKPGFRVSPERLYRMDENSIIGDSHIQVTKSKSARSSKDVASLTFSVSFPARDGTPMQLDFVGFPNDQGMLAKFVVRLQAGSAYDAELISHRGLSPILSGISMRSDVPLAIESSLIIECRTQTRICRMLAAFPERALLPAVPLSEEFAHYASIYREGLNSTSDFYRFLCFYKLLESLHVRRGRLNSALKKAGKLPATPALKEKVPDNDTVVPDFLLRIYPWQTTWDALVLKQIFPPESLGKSFVHIHQNILQELRNNIAHFLWEGGEITVSLDRMETILQVQTWLPLARCMTRVTLLNEFPLEIGF